MRSSLSLKTLLLVTAALIAFCLVALTQGRNSSHASGLPVGAPAPGCPSDNAGLKLPPGFCATVFADGMGHARHMVVAPDGVLYVNTWSGRYYGNGKTHPGGFLVALQDKAGSGKADVIERFGETVQTGGRGGTGVGFYKDSVYAEINDRIVRYSLPPGSIVPQAPPETTLFPDCLLAAIIPFIPSSSIPKAHFMST